MNSTEPKTRVTSQELAAASRRARRRARDRRALVSALVATVVAAALLYGVGWAWIQSVPERDPQAVTAPASTGAHPPGGAERSPAVPTPGRPSPAPERPGVISTPLDETPDLPAIRKLRDEGLTVGAEGLPEIRGPVAPEVAARFSCRFAYAIWELSPNRRFRFLTTCGREQGQTWVGAYEIRGTQVVTSALSAEGARWTSVLQLQKPTSVQTEVVVPPDEAPLRIRQKLTAVRPGMNGDAFFGVFSGKNPVQLPEGPSPVSASGEPPDTADKEVSDPLLDLLGSGR